MSKEKPLSELREYLIDTHKEFCYCSGPTCSGCEKKTSKLISIGFDAAAAHYEEREKILVEALREMAKWCTREANEKCTCIPHAALERIGE